MTSNHRLICQLVAFILLLLYSIGCAPKASTSRLTTDDLQTITIQMAESLGSSDFLSDRNPQSPDMIITLQSVQNLSSDLIPTSEQWYLVERVVDSLPVRELARSKNIRFVRAADKIREGRRRDNVRLDDASERAPTHILTATYTSVVRTTADERTDAYYCEYSIVDRASGELDWIDKFEFKREAFGLSWD